MKWTRRRAPNLLFLVPLLSWFAPGGAGRAAAAGEDSHATVRGMTVSCATWGWEWGTDEMVATMKRLAALGVNWIAIHPYARISEEGRVGGRFERWDRDLTWLTRPIEEAHRLGLKIMIKPHLAYWGTDFSWRGEIGFDDDEARKRFFATYDAWVVRLAEVCAGADGFVVGSELGRTVSFEKEWRAIIEDVRAVTEAPLTYGANWAAFEEVPFWDALDVIGIQWYFPVAESAGVPEPDDLDRAWEELIAKIDAFARPLGKKVLLTELGYNRSSEAAVHPWKYTTGGANAELVQERCLAAALRALETSDLLAGAFLWKWFPGERGGRNFILSTPEMCEVIAEHWRR